MNLKPLWYSALFLALALIGSTRFYTFNKLTDSEVMERFTSYFEDQSALLDEVLLKDFDDEAWNSRSMLEQLSALPFEFFAFRDDEPIFWTTDKVHFEPLPATGLVEFDFLLLGDGLYYVRFLKDTSGVSKYALLHLVHRAGGRWSASLNNTAAAPMNVSSWVYVEQDTTPYVLQNSRGWPRFYLSFETPTTSRQNDGWLFTLFFVLSLILIVFLWLRSKALSNRTLIQYYAKLFLLWMGVRLLYHFGWFKYGLATSLLFSPELYARSTLSASLGELLWNVFILFLGVQIVYFFCVEHCKKRTPSTLFRLLVVGFVPAVILVVISEQIRYLILDSNINFDPVRITDLTMLSVLGMVVIALYFYLFFYLLFLLKKGMRSSAKISRLETLGLLLFPIGVLLLYSALFHFTGYVYGVLFVIVSIASGYYILTTRLRDGFYFVWALCVSLLFTTIILHNVSLKEQEYRKLFANKSIYERDLEVEMQLIKAEELMERDRVLELGFYESEILDKPGLQELLKYEYLLDFLVDFEVDIHIYSGDYQGWSGSQLAEYNRFKTLYNESVGANLSKRFIELRKGSRYNGYMSAHQIGEEGHADYRALFIILRQKVRSSDRVFSEFTNRSRITLQNPYGYFFALYHLDKLVRVSPDFAFPRYASLLEAVESGTFVTNQGFNSYFFKPDLERTLIVVKPVRTFRQGFTVFAAIVLGWSILWFLVPILSMILRVIAINLNQVPMLLRPIPGRKSKFILPSFKSILLKNKIRTALLAELVVSFFVATLLVANFLSSSYADMQQRSILEKVKSISADLEKSGFLEQTYLSGPRKEFLMNLSESNNIDINLFDAYGRLLASSNMVLRQQKVLNNYINPFAFYNLVNQGLFSYQQEEQIHNLVYRSYYQAVFDKNQELAGFINLPYFDKQNEARNEITSLLVDVLNVFVLFFMLTAILSVWLSHFISRPLEIISQNLRSFKLGDPKQKINWYSEDELGQLVFTYNKVVSELDKSIAKLAQTEREGAWREMAKQVAHEIKNPLTPMKLSVQHLQRSVMQTDPQTQEKIQKSCTLLINQIDLMTKIADEFSSFAQMPVAKPKQMYLVALLHEVISLFENTDHLEIITNFNPQSTVLIFVDADQFKRVLINLIKNAHQARKSDQSCVLKIGIAESHNTVTVSFADNGSGIAPELEGRIFSPNFSTKTSGMGLGLAISKKIIELAGGTIHFKSRPQAGTTFYIKLPIV